MGPIEDNEGKHQAGCAVTPPLDIVKLALLSLATATQQAELYALIWACTLAKGKTANVYTISQYAFGVDRELGMLWKQ